MLGFLLVLALAAWTRVSSFREVLTDQSVLPVDGDAHYHVRRMGLVARDFPHVPVHDPLMNWPQGGPCHWPPGLDFLGGAVMAVLSDGPNSRPALVAVTLLPVALGVLVVACAVWLGLLLVPAGAAGQATALSAGLCLALLPQAVQSSMIGRVDHHVCEALFMALLGGWALLRFSATSAASTNEPASRRSRITWEATGALLCAGSLLFFAGSVVYVGLVAVLLHAALLFSVEGACAVPATKTGPDQAPAGLLGSGVLALAGGGVLAALGYLPAMAEHGKRLSFVFPSLFQPLLLGAAASSLTLCLIAVRLVRPTRPEGSHARTSIGLLFRRSLLWIGLLAVPMLCGALLFPRAFGELWAGLSGWLGRRDPWLAGIAEFQPLTEGASLFSVEGWTRIWPYFGAVGLLGAALIPLGLGQAMTANRGRGFAFALWTLGLLGLTLYQSRFGRIVAVNLALCCALAALSLVRLAAGRWTARQTPTRTGPETAWATVGADPEALGSSRSRGAAVLGLVILLSMQSPHSRSRLLPAPARPLAALEGAALALRLPPETPVRVGAREGVLAPWDQGHHLLNLSGRPVVATGFGHYLDARGFAEVAAAYNTDEAHLVELMTRRDLGFVVAGADTFFNRVAAPGPWRPISPGPDGRGRLSIPYLKAIPLGTLMLAGSGVPAAGIPSLRYLLPRWASVQMVQGLAFPMPVLWVYERVPGARLVGHTHPRARVTALLGMKVRGQPLSRLAFADADSSGAFTLTLPVPSGLGGEVMASAPAWLVAAGAGAPLKVAVSEDAVRHGQTLRLGPLPEADPAATDR